MGNILSLIESYGISISQILNHESLVNANFNECKKTMNYLYNSQLLKSKYIINKLAKILVTLSKEHLEKIENFLKLNDIDAYAIMYKANEILFSTRFEKMSNVMLSLKNPKYNLNYKKIIENYPTLLIYSSDENIEKTINLLNKYNLDINYLATKSGSIFDKGDRSEMEKILNLIFSYFGNDKAKELIYKSASVLTKGSSSDISFALNFFESKYGKDKAIKFWEHNFSALAKVKKERLISLDKTLQELNIGDYLYDAPILVSKGEISDIRNNYLWLNDRNPSINLKKAPTTLTTPHSRLIDTYSFYTRHNLDMFIHDNATCLATSKSKEEMEDLYQYLISIGITDFRNCMTVFTSSSLYEIKEIYKLLIVELGQDVASTLIKTPSILLANYRTTKDAITFIRNHNLYSELKENPYLLTQTTTEKMEDNISYLSSLQIGNLDKNLTIITRGNVNNMKKIIECLSSYNLLDTLLSCPTILLKQHKSVELIIKFFEKRNKINLLKQTPSYLTLDVEELEKTAVEVEKLGEDIINNTSSIYRARNITSNRNIVDTSTLDGSSIVASVYTTSSTMLEARKAYYDKKGLSHLYKKCPSILSEGNLELIDESYTYLVEEGYESIFDTTPSIISRLKGKEVTKNRIKHLKNLGLTKEDILRFPYSLVRYSDEQILKSINLNRKK